MKIKFYIGMLLTGISLIGIARTDVVALQNKTECFLISNQDIKKNPGEGVAIISYDMTDPKNPATLKPYDMKAVSGWVQAPLIKNSEGTVVILANEGNNLLYSIPYDKSKKYIVTDVRTHDCWHPNNCYIIWDKAC